MMHIEFPPFPKKIINFPQFPQHVKTPPYFGSIYVFLPDLRFLLPHILTMMHLCIMLYTYWTPLPCNTTTPSRPVSVLLNFVCWRKKGDIKDQFIVFYSVLCNTIHKNRIRNNLLWMINKQYPIIYIFMHTLQCLIQIIQCNTVSVTVRVQKDDVYLHLIESIH